jgi:Transposase IS4
LLNKIVSYTNEYGKHKSKEWTAVTKGDLMDFISVLLISGIQKRKDAPANWFSNSPIRENPIMKQITTGKKFHTMLMYLHVCSLTGQPNVPDPDYSPIYKVREMLEYLEECNVGSGQSGRDCFALCHENDNLRKAALAKYISMKKKTNKRCLT